MCVEKEKLLGRHNKVAKWRLITFKKYRSNCSKSCSCKNSHYSQEEQESTCVEVSF